MPYPDLLIPNIEQHRSILICAELRNLQMLRQKLVCSIVPYISCAKLHPLSQVQPLQLLSLAHKHVLRTKAPGHGF